MKKQNKKNKQTWFTHRKKLWFIWEKKSSYWKWLQSQKVILVRCFFFCLFCFSRKQTQWTRRVHHLAIGIHSFPLSCSLRCHYLKGVFGGLHEGKARVSAEWRERMERHSFKLLIRISLRFIISKQAEIRNQQKTLNTGFFSQKALWVCRI